MDGRPRHLSYQLALKKNLTVLIVISVAEDCHDWFVIDVMAFNLKDFYMNKINFDSIVKSAASNVNEKDVAVASQEVISQIEGRAWNMNQPLNMIAYEGQK